MKTAQGISAGILLLLFGAVAPTYAQQSKPDQAAQPKKDAPQPARLTPGLRGHLPEAQPQAQGQRMGQGEQRGMWHRYRAENWRSEHRGWRQRGGYGGFSIPDDQFRWNFGRMNWFRISDRQLVMVNGGPRFEYQGYWFRLADPWPEYWADNWYETDNVYIDYVDDGYYLFNKSHPDDRVAVDVFVE